MERHIALDVHAESTTAVAQTSAGRDIWVKVVETSAQPLIDLVKSVASPRKVIMEEGTQSEWLYEVLRPHADDVVVVMPERRNPTKAKSDERDARGLLELLQRGKLRRVFKGVGTTTTIREAVRNHRLLTEDRVRAQNRLYALLRSRGVLARTLDDEESRKAAIAQLPPHYQPRAQTLSEQIEYLTKLGEKALENLSIQAKRNPAVALLSTAPGIGLIRAATIVATVVDPRRFRTKRQFWSYCGLAIVTVNSAEWRHDQNEWVRSKPPMTRGLNRNRNGSLKDVFKGAAHTVITQMPNHPLNASCQLQVAHGTRDDLAKLTLARRIAGTCLAMWKHWEVYDPKKNEAHIRA